MILINRIEQSDWTGQMKTVMNEFYDTQFIWVEPDRNTVRRYE